MNRELAEARWFKSSRSKADGNCVEVAFLQEGVAVRDSKSPSTGTAASSPASTWAGALTKSPSNTTAPTTG
ncbi:DUF397 domain-containing protein, partial [Nocardia cyriacigeorgica]